MLRLSRLSNQHTQSKLRCLRVQERHAAGPAAAAPPHRPRPPRAEQGQCGCVSGPLSFMGLRGEGVHSVRLKKEQL